MSKILIPEITTFILTKRGKYYTLWCKGNEMHTNLFRKDSEAIKYYKHMISFWDRAELIFKGEEDEV